MNEDTAIRQLRWVLALAAVVLGLIGWAMLRVEGGAAAFPPLALAVACALTCLGLWLGSKRTLAVLVVSATAIAGGAFAYRTETTPQADAHTWSCIYPNTQLGNIQRATCQYNLWFHLYQYQQRLIQYQNCMVFQSMGYDIYCGSRPTH